MTTTAATPEDDAISTEGATSYEYLLSMIDQSSGVITPEIALTAFALQFGNVPGALNLPIDDSQPHSATGALRLVYQVWDELTDEQRAAVADRVDWPDVAAAEAFGVNAIFASYAEPSAAERAMWDAMAADFAGQLNSRLGGRTLDYDLKYGNVDRGDAGTGPDSFMLWSNDSCDITLDEARTSDEAAQRSAMAHEMFHCWSLMNSESVLAWHRTPMWYQEGVASWAGETLAGASNYSTSWWNGYLLPGRSDLRLGVYAIDYHAIGFWSGVDAAIGGRLWDAIPTLNTLAGQGSNSQLFEGVLLLTGADGMARIAAGATLRPAWGSSWTMTGPGITSTGRRNRDIDVSVTEPASTTVLNSEQRLDTFHIQVDDPTAPHIVEVQAQGLMLGRWNTGEEFLVTDSDTLTYCVGECTCPDGSSLSDGAKALGPAASALSVAITGGASSSSKVGVSLSVLDEACEEEVSGTESGSPLDRTALIGTWVATDEAIVRMFNNSFAYDLGSSSVPPLKVTGVAGDITISFDQAGTAIVRYEELTLVLEEGSPIPALTINGSGKVSWDLEGFLIVFSGDSDFTLVATADVLGSEIEFPISNVDIGSRGGESSFVLNLDGGRLQLTFAEASDGMIFFPNVWVPLDR